MDNLVLGLVLVFFIMCGVGVLLIIPYHFFEGKKKGEKIDFKELMNPEKEPLFWPGVIGLILMIILLVGAIN